MTNELARVTGGRVAFGDAVARVAESLSPLGAVARVIAESTACAVEIKKLQVTGRRIDAETEVSLARLENRREDASASLRELRRQVGQTDLTAAALRQCIRNMQRALGRPRTTVAEAQAYAELIRGFSAELLHHHSQQGDQVLAGIGLVLNDAGTGSSARAGGRRGTQHTGAGRAPSGNNNRVQDNPARTGKAQAQRGNAAAKGRTGTSPPDDPAGRRRRRRG